MSIPRRPTVGVLGADADAAGGDDHDVALREIGQRVDFVAAIYGQGAAAEEEKGHVGAQAGGDFDQSRQRQARFW